MLEDMIYEARLEDDCIKDSVFTGETIIDCDLTQLEFNEVEFNKCNFVSCNFSKAGFYNTIFKNCNISNCIFDESYWKQWQICGCKGDGASFINSHFKYGQIEDSSFCYSNFSQSVVDDLIISNSQCKHISFMQSKLKKMVCNKVVFSGAEFFKTPLKGIDFSTCEIDGMMVSELLTELKGAKISALQALDIARMTGVIII